MKRNVLVSLLLLLVLLAHTGNVQSQIVVTPTITNVSCYGGSNGSITVSPSGGNAFCSPWTVPPQTTCSNCTQSISGNTSINISSGMKVCILANTTFTGSINMSGGDLVICGTANPQNFSTNGGTITVIGTLNCNVVNYNNGLIVYNYGTITTSSNITGNGQIYNYNRINCGGDYNVNQNGLCMNYGTIDVLYNTFNNSATTTNNGLIRTARDIQNNSSSIFTNNCTIICGRNFNNSSPFINNGSIQVTRNGHLNNQGTMTMGAGASMSVNSIHVNANLTGPSTGCASLFVEGNFTNNNSGVISGNMYICDNDGIETNTGTIGNGAVYGCNCGSANANAEVQYTYQWANSAQNSNTLTNLTAGTYSVIVTDAQGRATTTSVIVSQPALLTATTTYTNALYPGATNGSATAVVSGGTSPYTYVWSNGSTSATATGLGQGSYTVQITDANGCQTSASVVIGFTYPLIINNTISATQSVVSGNAPALFNGSLPGGGTGTYTYQWERSTNGSTWTQASGATQRNFQETGVSAFTYYRRIVASGGIPAITSNIITVRPLNYTLTATNNGPVFVGSTLNLSSTTTAPNGGVYTWYGPNGFSSSGINPVITNATVGATGIYTVTLTIDNVTLTTTTSAAVYPGISNTISASQTVITGNAPAQFNGNLPTGGTGSYAYQWLQSTDGVNWTSVSGATHQNYTAGAVSVFTHFKRNIISGSLPVVTSNIVTVTPVNYTLTAVNNGPLYEGRLLQLRANTNAPSGGVYTWAGPNGFTATGDAPAINSVVLANAGVYTVTLSINNVTLTATTTPAVYSVLSNTISASQTVVAGNLPAQFNGNIPTGGMGAYTYQWEESADAINWTSISGATAQNYTAGPVNAYMLYRRKVTSGTLTPIASNIVTVIPVNYTLTASNNGPVYEGSTLHLSSVTNAPNGGVYTWTGPNGFTGTGSALSIPNATVAASGVYTVTLWINNVVLTATTSPVVYPALSNTISASQTVVTGNAPAQFNGNIPTGGTGSYLYQWEQSTDGVNWISISGATSVNYSAGSVNTFTEYRRKVTSGSLPVITSNTVSVTPVNYTLTASNNGPVYAGSTLGLSSTSTAPNGGVYSWVGPNGYTGTGAAPSISNATVAATGVYTVTLNIDNLVLTATTSPEVYPVLVNNTISTSQTIVSGNSPAPFVGGTPSGGTGVYTYVWEKSTDGGLTWTTISGATSQNFPEGPVSVATEYRRKISSGNLPVVVSNVVTVTPVNYTLSASNNGPVYAGSTLGLSSTTTAPNGGVYSWVGPNGYTGTGAAPSISNATVAATGVYTVTLNIDNLVLTATTSPEVYPVIVNNTISTSQTIVSGNSPAPFVGGTPSGGTGVYTYVWEKSTDGGLTWTTISGATSQNFPEGPVSVSTDYRRKISSGNLPVVVSNVVTVTPVNYTLSASNNGPVYEGSTLGLSSTTTAPNGGVYSWVGPNGYTGTGIAPSIPNATVAATGLYTLTLTVDNLVLTATTSPVVYPALSNTISASQTVIAGNTPAQFNGNIPTGGTGSYLYQWEQSTDGVSWISISGATSVNYSAGSVNTFTEYRRTITSGNLPVVLSNSVSVTPVNYTLSASNNGPVYEGSTLGLSSTSTAPNGGVYSWVGPNGYTGTGIAPSISNATVAATGVYTVTLNIDNLILTATTSPEVYPVLVNNTISTSQTIVSGNSPAPFVGGTPSGGTGVYTYVWEKSTDGGLTWTTISGATSQNFPEGPVSVSTDYRRKISSGNLPVIVSNVVTVTPVNYTLSASNNGPVYEGSTLGLSSTSTAPNGGVYSWVGPNGYTGTGIAPSIPNATVAATGVYTVTLNIDNLILTATTSPEVYPVLVNNTISTSQTIISGFSPAPFVGGTPSGGTGTYTYEWEKSTDGGLTWITISGATGQHFPEGPVSVSTEYRRKISSGNLPVIVSNVVSVTPINYTLSASNNGPIFEGSTLQLSSNTSAPNGGVYTWAGPNGYTGTGISPAIQNATLAATGVYTVTLSIDNQVITATTSPVVYPYILNNVISASQTVLMGGTPAEFQGSIPSGGMGSYTYQWEKSTNNGTTWTSISGASNQNFSEGSVSVYTEYRRVLTSGSLPSVVSNVVSVLPLNYILTAIGTSPVCSGDSLKLDAACNIPGAVYNWSGPNGYTFQGQSPVITPVSMSNAGVYSLTASRDNITLVSTTTVVVLDPFNGAAASSNSPVCEGNQLQLSSASLAGVTYSWSGPNGFTSLQRNNTISQTVHAMTGNYTLTLGHNVCGTRELIIPAAVNVAAARPSSNSPACEGATIGLTAFPNVGATYNWSGPGAFTQSGVVISRQPALAIYTGTYRVVADIPGCGTGFVDSIQVTVGRDVSAVTASTNAPVCSNSTLTVNTTSVPGANYSWQGPNGFTSILTNVTKSAVVRQDSGMYTLTVTSPGCQPKVIQINVAVNDPALLVAQNNSPVCIGGTFNLSASCPLASSFTWAGPLGFTSNNQYNTLTNGVLANTGMYSVYANIPGCGVVYTPTAVAVNEPATVLNVTSNAPLCTGQILTLSVNSYQNAEYIWTGPSGRTSSGYEPVFNRVNSTHAGVYSVTVNVPACGSNSAISMPVTITDIPGLNAYSNSPICDRDYMYLDCASIFGATYRWTGPNGYTSSRQGPGEEAVSFSYSGQYTVTANVPGCGAVYDVVDVMVYPAIRSVTAGSNSPICQGSTIALTALQVPSANYFWTGPNGFTASSANVNIGSATVQHSGIYTLTITSPACPIHYCYVNVIVGSSQLLPITTTSPACAGSTLVLSAPWVANTTYSWTAPNGNTYNSPDITVGYARLQDAGIYTLTTNFIGCGSVTNSVSVVVNFPTNRDLSVWTNSPVCAGGDIMLSVPYNSSGSYVWTGPNGFTSNSNAPIIPLVNTSHAGQYSLSVMVPGCGVANYLARAVVNRLPVLTASSNSPVCQGNSVYLYCASDIPFTICHWEGPNGFTSTLKEPGFHNATPLCAGQYTIISTVPGCGQSFSVANVVVNPAINSISVNSNTPLCSGQTLVMTSTLADGANYFWQGPAGFTSNTKDFTRANVTTAHTGYYSLTITQPGCGVRQLTHYVNVFATAAPVATSAKATYCSGENVYLNCTSVVGATSYRWNGPNGFSYNGMYGSISNAQVNRSGEYTVSVTHPACGTMTSIANVTVNPMVNNYSLTTNSPVCLGGTMTLSSNIPSGGSAIQVWTAPNGNTIVASGAAIPNVTFDEAGTYVYTVTSPGCGTSTRSVRVLVNNPNTVTASVNTPLCRGQAAYFSASSGAGTTYSWTGPSSYVSSSQWASRSNVQVAHSGQYTLSASVPGCGVITRTVDLVVNNCRIAGEDSGDEDQDETLNNAGAGSEDAIAESLPAENLAVLESFKVYPNPFSEQVSCAWSDMTVFSIKIFDLNGKMVYEVEPGEVTGYQIQTGHLPSGVYMMTVLTSAGPKNVRITRL